jgi:hypothetical protein
MRDMLDGVDWIYLVQVREEWGACEHGNKPLRCLNCWKIFE